jgi:hypothetical protein
MVTIINRTKKIKYKCKRYKRSKKSRLSKRCKKSIFSKRSNNKSRSCFYQSKGGGKLLDVLTKHHNARDPKKYEIVRSEMLKVLKEYCDLFLKSFEICGTNCNNYLFKKLSNVALNERIDPEDQETIILQVQDDFTELIKEVIQRVTQDKALLQKHLGIPQSHTLVLVECLGDESHNHGKIALKLVFNDSKSIVYKPRSLLAEDVLCNKTNSVFQMANLGTYTTINLGNYGYQEYLENIKDENTMTSPELVEYMKDISTTEKICKQLRISDLHCDNVVTCNKKLLLIDLEVYLVPREITTETGLLKSDLGGAEFFNNYEGYCSHNKIWLKDKTRPTGVTFENLKEKYDVEFISQDKIILSLEVMKGIDNAKKKLMSTPGRLVLITTDNLKGLINSGYPYNEYRDLIIMYLTEFFDENTLITSHLSDSDTTERIIKAFQEDFLHNDVPIFYYDSIKKIITYHDITIGSIPTTPGSIPTTPGSMPESMSVSLQNFRDNLPLPEMTDLEWSQYVGKMRKRYGGDWLNIIKENMGRSVFGMATPVAAQAAAVVSAPAVSHDDDIRNYMAMDGDKPVESDEIDVG